MAPAKEGVCLYDITVMTARAGHRQLAGPVTLPLSE